MKRVIKNIGILGGTFDPPHVGHVKISTIAKNKFKLKNVIWAITKKSPFKNKSSLNLNRRIFLAKKIIKNKPYIKVKHYENKIKSNKTYNLLKYLTKRNKNCEFYFLMGADNLINFHKWYKWKEISLNCNILVFDRAGYRAKSLKSLTFKSMNKNKLKFISFKKVNISSSKLRKI